MRWQAEVADIRKGFLSANVILWDKCLVLQYSLYFSAATFGINNFPDLEVYSLKFRYMGEKLGIEESKIASLCASLYADYGTTLAGLVVSTDGSWPFSLGSLGRFSLKLLVNVCFPRNYCIPPYVESLSVPEENTLDMTIQVHGRG